MAAVMWTSLLLSLAPLLHLQAFTLAPEVATKAPPHPHTDTQIDDPVLASHSTVWPSWAPVVPTAGARMADSLDWFPGLKDSTLAPEETEKKDNKGEFRGTISDYTETQGFNPLTRPTSPAPVNAQLGSTTDSDQHQPRAQATNRELLALDFPATQQRDILEGDIVVEEIGDELQDFTENLTEETGTDTSKSIQPPSLHPHVTVICPLLQHPQGVGKNSLPSYL